MTTTWFGRFELETNTTRVWRIGPCSLWLQRLESEWRALTRASVDTMDEALAIAEPVDDADLPTDGTIHRFGFRSSPSKVIVRPALPDRPVIVSPEDSFQLPRGESTTLYLSLPVWIQVSFGDDPTALLDEPAQRPTDTWFGESTTRGELCYAVRTAARTHLENLPSPPHRAISVVEIRNHGRRALMVEKLRIPAQQQSVFAAPTGELWTEGVVVDATDDRAMATVRLESGPPAVATDAVRQADPRVPTDTNLLMRTFGSLMG